MSDSHDLSTEEQIALGIPALVEQLNDAEIQEYLSLLEKKMEQHAINLFTPSTLINKDIYLKLTELQQGRVDFSCMNLVHLLRQVKQLQERNEATSAQMENLVQTIFQYKNKLENEMGDVLVI